MFLEVPTVDESAVERLRDALGQETLARLLSAWPAAADDLVRQLETAIAAGDLKAVGRAAHSIKGLAGNYGFRRFSRLAVELEEAGADHAALAEALRAELVRAKAEVTRLTA